MTPGAARTADPELVARVRGRLAGEPGPVTPARLAAAVRAEAGLLGDAGVRDLLAAVELELTGAGPLEPLLAAPGVTDVLVNAPDEVWVDGEAGLQRAPIRFPDEAAVRRLAQRLAARGGRRLDDAAPWVDARLPDGVRVHAVLPPLAPRGTCLSLRVPRRQPFTVAELVAAGTFTPYAAALLADLVAARVACLVTGGTATGKTTVLATLLGRVPPGERIVLVEDSAELLPDHPHLVRLEARPANCEGAGAVTLRDLVRQALRMRPDRLVVGEVRGGEVVDLLAALNTGHEGGLATLHANAAGDVPARVEALALSAGMRRSAVHRQLAAGLQAVLHLVRGPDGRRRLAEIGVLCAGPRGPARVVPALAFLPDGAAQPGPGQAHLDQLLAGRGCGGPG